jgi:hypothetical protein
MAFMAFSNKAEITPLCASMKMSKSFIIKVRYGGLGDHLFWSHLPRIAKTYGGYQYVYISNQSVYRYNDYRKLIWEMNPYVDGFCDEDGPDPNFAGIPPDANILDMLMIFMGLDDGKRFHEPEIFYKPKLRKELAEARIFDPNYLSNAGAVSNRTLLRYLKESGGVDYQMRVRDRSFGVQREIPILNSANVFEYCDIIASCRDFLCLTSGGATLAAALGQRSIVFYGYGQNADHRHSRLHQYVDVSTSFTRTARSVVNFFYSVTPSVAIRLVQRVRQMRN